MKRIYLIFICLLYQAIAEVLVTDPQQLRQSFSAPQLLSTSSETFATIQGGLYAPENFNYCKNTTFVNSTRVANNFVLLDARGKLEYSNVFMFTGGCYVDWEDLQPYIENGALGAIMLVKPHNPYTRTRDECNKYKRSENFPMKVVLLFFSETEDYLNTLKQSNVTVQVSSGKIANLPPLTLFRGQSRLFERHLDSVVATLWTSFYWLYCIRRYQIAAFYQVSWLSNYEYSATLPFVRNSVLYR